MRGFAIRARVKEARVLIMEHRTRVTVEMGTRVQVVIPATFVLKVTKNKQGVTHGSLQYA